MAVRHNGAQNGRPHNSETKWRRLRNDRTDCDYAAIKRIKNKIEKQKGVRKNTRSTHLCALRVKRNNTTMIIIRTTRTGGKKWRVYVTPSLVNLFFVAAVTKASTHTR